MEQPRDAGGHPPGRSSARRRVALKVEVQLFASFQTFLPASPDGRALLELPEGATVEAVARRLGIPDEMARVVLLNGRDAEPDRPLAAGDVVTIFPPLMGGSAPGATRARSVLHSLALKLGAQAPSPTRTSYGSV